MSAYDGFLLNDFMLSTITEYPIHNPVHFSMNLNS
jgi:hypothetical protein